MDRPCFFNSWANLSCELTWVIHTSMDLHGLCCAKMDLFQFYREDTLWLAWTQMVPPGIHTGWCTDTQGISERIRMSGRYDQTKPGIYEYCYSQAWYSVYICTLGIVGSLWVLRLIWVWIILNMQVRWTYRRCLIIRLFFIDRFFLFKASRSALRKVNVLSVSF